MIATNSRRIPIRIHPFFWLFALLIGWFYTSDIVGMLIWVGVIFVSVLFHELGHAVTAIFFGQEASIQLVIFGGITTRTGKKLSLWKEFLITLNGPLAGFILGVAAFAAATWFHVETPIVLSTLKILIFVNIFWSVVNLLPVLPLDGGHLLRIVLEGIFGWKGTRIALFVGMMLGVLLSILFFVIQQLFMGALFLLLAFESFRSWRAARLLSEKDTNESLQTLYRKAEAASQSGEFLEAIELLQQIRMSTGKGVLYVASTQLLAGILTHQNEKKEAYQLLKEVRDHLDPEMFLLFQQLAFDNGDYDTVVQVGAECYQISASYKVAFTNALAHAVRGEAEPAIGWLQCAKRDGMPQFEEALQKPEFDRIRSNPGFHF